MGGQDKVGILDDQVVNGYGGKIELERLPVRAIVKRDLDTGFGSGEEQSTARGVLADGACEVVAGEAGGDLHPGCAVVVGLEEVGREVIPFVAVGGEIGGRGIVRRRLDDAD